MGVPALQVNPFFFLSNPSPLESSLFRTAGVDEALGHLVT